MNLWRLSSQESIPDRARSSEGEKWHMPSAKDNGALRSSRADPRETCAEAADPGSKERRPGQEQGARRDLRGLEPLANPHLVRHRHDPPGRPIFTGLC